MAGALNDQAMLLTEAAAFLRVHPVTLRRMASRGQVPAVKAGGWRFARPALEAWLAGAYTRAPSTDPNGHRACSDDAAKPARITSDSPRQTGAKYTALLGLPTGG